MRKMVSSTLLVLLVSACGKAEAPAADDAVAVAVDTVSGVVHVRNSGDPAGWTLERELRLGSVEGGPEEFGRIRALLADGDGSVYVADNLAAEVRVFAADGRHLRTFGRRGRGPEEFQDLYGLAWVGGDQLATLDPGNARIGIMSREGELLSTWRHYPISGPPSRVRLYPDGVHGFYAVVIDEPSQGRLPLRHYTLKGPGEIIPFPEPPAGVRGSGVVCHTPDGGITGIQIQDAPALVAAYGGPDRLRAVSWTDRYRLALLAQDGDTVRVVERMRPPVPFSDAAWEEQSAPFRELRERFPGARCDPSAPERPAHRAALRHVLFDEAGRMWVEAATPDGFAWEVFDAEGRLVASAPAPLRDASIPPYVRGDRLYQVETDDVDVQYVGVYRLTRGRRHGIGPSAARKVFETPIRAPRQRSVALRLSALRR